MRQAGIEWRGSIAGVLIGMLILLAIPGCNAPVRTSDRDIAYLEDEMMREFARDDQGSRGARGTVIIDSRSPSSYEAGHIPGAINVLLGDSYENDRRLANSKRIIVYGAHADDAIAKALTKKLLEARFSNTFLYRNGIEGWRAMGFAVETDDAAQN